MARFRKPTYTNPDHFKPSKPAFDRLCVIEPELRELEREAGDIDWGPGYSANEVWYGPWGMKHRMSELVGHEARRPELRDRDSYDIAYEWLYCLLPDDYPEEPNARDRRSHHPGPT